MNGENETRPVGAGLFRVYRASSLVTSPLAWAALKFVTVNRSLIDGDLPPGIRLVLADSLHMLLDAVPGAQVSDL